MSTLFSPFQLQSLTLRNRIAIPPMCQYQAVDGLSNDWHWAHYAALGRGGAGLVIVEATAVAAEGRITPACLGLWQDAQIDGLARIAHAIKAGGAVPGIQLAHAGRKANANPPWLGDNQIAAEDPAAWTTLAPSALAYGHHLPRIPQAVTRQQISRIQADFVAAAKRALAAGFEWLELHFAHGYLAQSFLSVHSNRRTDDYGGDLAGRARFLLETLSAVRQVWPSHLPLTVRLGVIEYDDRDEETLQESIQVLQQLRQLGLDLVSVSVGFTIAETRIPWRPAFLAPVTARVRRETGLAVASAWGIDAAEDAERVVAEQQMDLVMIGRAHLANPHYPYRLAQQLGIPEPESLLPAPYAHWLTRYQGAARQP
ncbi:NADH:flavin oxidoreductase/NADH oxidase [Pseudaeromonas sharmana]|uniref:NADH:flavin oxidoreductase/NADH oxidase n=1 Tax=Pseudaeromonas sharmana TaxID=328412 RepID=A0ABV8CNS2_9GAMM